MRLGDLIAGLGVRLVNATPGVEHVRICDLTEDSRTVVPGSLFIARAGLKADGKRFVQDAARAGAVAVMTDDPSLPSPNGLALLHADDTMLASALMAERFYRSPSQALDLVGVTGTNGKTSTTYFVWRLMNAAAHRCGLIGTVIVDDGVEVAPASMTTPPAIETSRTLSLMAESGCRAAALEVSSHALDQRRADALRFKVGVFTNLTGDHLDYHGTMDRYAEAKARLFELLPPDGLALVNALDPWTPRMLANCRASVLTCAVGDSPNAAQAHCRGRILEETLEGMLIALTGPWGEITGRVPMIGRYNAMNLLQAVASAHALGLRPEEIDRALPRLTAPPGRIERVSLPEDGVTVLVDYAHSDDSLASVLSAAAAVMPGRRNPATGMADAAGAPLSLQRPGKLWVVFGCGGDRDTTKRPRMGRVAADLADRVVVTSDNPRSERPSDIVDQVLSGIDGSLRHKVQVQVDRARAIRLAIESAELGDVIVIAGKGHETEQILPDGQGGTIKTHFDDREVARTILEERRPARPAPAGRGPNPEPARRHVPGRSPQGRRR